MKDYGRLVSVVVSCVAASGCGTSANTAAATDAGAVVTDTGTRSDTGTVPAPVVTGLGTCERPIDLATAGTRTGTEVVYRGTTAGRPNALHPYPGCVAVDGAEAVMAFRVPAGVRALEFSTDGSGFDTVIYARSACSQAATGTDLGCNNDSYDHAPQSSVYVNNAVEGQTIYVVVDAAGDAENAPDSGDFVLTVRDVPFGAASTPCRPIDETGATPRCDAPLRCSEGAADGTAICVPSVGTSFACDPRGFLSACGDGLTCVTDPAAVEGGTATASCRLPGTHLGAPCRTADPRCDSPMSCGGTTEALLCVPVIALGSPCDPEGQANRCATGTTCSALGAGGPVICH